MLEAIPSEDQVSRQVDSPHKWHPEEERFIEVNLFQLAGPREVESLVWRKYAPELSDVHLLGCNRQAEKRTTRPDWTYEGAITAQVGAVRSIVNREGDRFEIVHAPDEGLHHAHIEYRLVEAQERKKQRKNDLKEFLRAVFSPLVAHKC